MLVLDAKQVVKLLESINEKQKIGSDVSEFYWVLKIESD